MITFALIPFVASVATLTAALTWCRDGGALTVTALGSTALFVAVRVMA